MTHNLTLRGFMEIVLYCGFNSGYGDLSFGRKVAEEVKKRYPDAQITVLTTESDNYKWDLNLKTTGASLDAFNLGESPIKIRYIDEWEKDRNGKKPDLLICGPVLNHFREDENDFVAKVIESDKNVPIILIDEYNFAPHIREGAHEKLEKRKYQNISEIQSGIGQDKQGIIISEEIKKFDKNKNEDIELVKNNLNITGETLLKGKDIKTYMDSTDISVNYSHNNAERLIHVHSGIKEATKDTDLVILGEKDEKDLEILKKRSEYLINKGFSQVIYEKPDGEQVVVGKSEKPGPIYRVVHTGKVLHTESEALRKISGDFGGCTGNQSFTEAIAKNKILLYETMTFNVEFMRSGIVALATQVDDKLGHEGVFSRTVELLCTAKSESEYEELITNLNSHKFDEAFTEFQKQTLAKDLIGNISNEINSSLNVVNKNTNANKKKNNVINEFLNNDLNGYKEVKFDSHVGWMRKTTTTLFGNEKKRMQQVDLINNTFTVFKDKDNISYKDKALLAFAVLSQVTNEIKKESLSTNSTLKNSCDQKLHTLKETFPEINFEIAKPSKRATTIIESVIQPPIEAKIEPKESKANKKNKNR